VSFAEGITHGQKELGAMAAFAEHRKRRGEHEKRHIGPVPEKKAVLAGLPTTWLDIP
jgi:hypothetical protein